MTNLVRFSLRRTGAAMLFCAEPAAYGSQSFSMQGVHAQRIQFEAEALRALEAGEVGSWTRFPAETIEATVTRDQLRRMGFRGNY